MSFSSASKRIRAALALCFLFVTADLGQAQVQWDWSWGSEAGYFITDGSAPNGVAPAGTYNVLDFAVTASSRPGLIGSMSGGGYNEGTQPGTGFTWDGSSDTQWFRSGGTYTNGTNYYSAGAFGQSYRYLFYPGFYELYDPNDNPVASSSSMAFGVGTSSVGFEFCSPSSDNSTGSPAALVGSPGVVAGSNLHLEITGGVPGQLTYFLVGNQATSGVVVSNGLFCLVGTSTAQFYRYNVGGTNMNSIGGFDASGTMVNASGTSSTGFGFDVPSTIPDIVPIAIMAGDTWHFQGWYRDTPAGSGTSNFTNGLGVTF